MQEESAAALALAPEQYPRNRNQFRGMTGRAKEDAEEAQRRPRYRYRSPKASAR